MNKSVLMIMAGALVVALLVAMIVQAKLSPPPQAAAQASVEILVTNKKILAGDKLLQKDLRWQSWPETAVYAGLIRKSEEPDLAKLTIYDSPLRRTIEAGEPVSRTALFDIKGAGNILAGSLAEGMRAVALNVKSDTTAGGFMAPGDHVDVILAYRPEIRNDDTNVADSLVQRYASQTVLSNVKVLAVDQDAKNTSRDPKVSKTVTLEVTRAGAEVLAMAKQMGEITLALRRIGDKDEPASTVSPLVTDMSVSTVLQKYESLKKKTKAQSNVIRVYSGNTVENMPVRLPPAETQKRETAR